MWEIYESHTLVRNLPKIPYEVLKRYEKWKDIVELTGPEGLRLIKGFHDEALKGQWLGHRSSRLELQFRLIYRVEDNKLYARVINITAHDYRRT
ncbi:MAG: type II toxin-antitoxin system mRNA interferase toxin, RelE/StbE family [Kiritimatiellae bacterium]|nr:type II toxin-antitoxin system mRNA interferase toxin, RelE/StbE family [Kiritimatiellia bacterium]